MRLPIRTGCVVVCALAISAASAQTRPADPTIPHLEKRGLATQLIVDGKPFLALSGEQIASSNLEHLQNMWPVWANKVHMNTVLLAMAWAWIEPAEGKYDFRMADAMIENARRYDLRIVWLWFASWKNGLSSFAPAWVKADQDRFPRAQVRDGKTVEVLSTLSENNREADARAFAALMRHVREVDESHRVIMVQVENEVGLLGDSRDRSPLANEAFAARVPTELMDYLQKHKDELLPEFRKVWEAAGFKTSGTWEEVFGKGPRADEIFMAWNYSRYINRVAESGKKEYPVPMFVNVWLVQPQDKGIGDYPSGGAEDHVHDIWKAGAPRLDMFCPDIHLSNFVSQGLAHVFAELTTRYSRSGNPLYIPEAAGDIRGAANAFYAIGQQRSIGYSTTSIASLPAGLMGSRPDATAPSPQPPPDIEALPLPQAYLTLSQMAPLILEHQSRGTIAGVELDNQKPDTQVKLGNYILNVGLPRDRRTLNVVPDVVGYGLFMAVGPDEYLLAGNNLEITFTPDTPGAPIAGLAEQEAGRFENGKWVVTRFLGGDDSVLRYDMATVAAMNQSGSGVRLRSGESGIQRVKLYRYR
jgi:hypothetical protein